MNNIVFQISWIPSSKDVLQRNDEHHPGSQHRHPARIGPLRRRHQSHCHRRGHPILPHLPSVPLQKYTV